MIKVKLKSKNYTPSPYNPIIDSKYECVGELLYVVDKDLKHHEIKSIMLLDNLNPELLTLYPMVVKWYNDILNNINSYKIPELLYYKENNNLKSNFKSIW